MILIKPAQLEFSLEFSPDDSEQFLNSNYKYKYKYKYKHKYKS